MKTVVKPPRVLVTGATGYLGNYVVEQLLQFKIQVVATGRNRSKAENNSWFKKVEYIDFPATEVEDYFKHFGHPDRLIHLAWEGLPNYNSSHHLSRNLPQNYSFLENMALNGLQHLCCIGTCFEYGLQYGCLDENSPTTPVTYYGLSKKCLYEALSLLQQKHDFQLIWPRVFYLSGDDGERPSLLASLRKAIQQNLPEFKMSKGEQIRDFQTPETAALQIVATALQNEVNGPINIASGTPTSVRRLVEHYISTHASSIQLNLGYYPYPDYEPMEFWGSTQKLNKALAAFKPNASDQHDLT